MTGQDNPSPAPFNPFAERQASERAQKPVSPPAAHYPIYELGVQAARRVDAIALEEFGIPSIALMENAATALCHHAIGMLSDRHAKGVVLFCGPGNNGGDGLALARHLHNHQIPVRVRLLNPANQYRGDARINMDIIERMRLDVALFESGESLQPALVVDALFGTGLSRAPDARAGEMIQTINAHREHGALVLAVDVPSGLDADSGEPMVPCVLADRTVTFAAFKSGFAALGAQNHLGHVVVEGIGIPIEILDRLGTRVQQPARGSGKEP